MAKTADQLKRYEFRTQLEGLRGKSGRGTELVSILIPHDKQISDVTSQLRDEYGQAANIKSKTTRLNVQSALDSVMSRLRFVQRAPLNGVAIYCGAIDIGGNKTEMETIIIEPIKQIKSYKYHCSSSFLLEPLEEMLMDTRVYGLLVLDRREATVGLLKGKIVQPLKHMTSSVPGKQRQGGQSAMRFQRLREIAITDFYKRIGEHTSEILIQVEPKELQGILVGGPSPTKEEFVSGEYLHHELQQKIIGKFDVSYTDESGLYELVDRASETMQNIDVMHEKQVMNRFMRELVGEKSLATYGEEHVRRNLEMGAVDTLLFSEDLRMTRLRVRCSSCNTITEVTVRYRLGTDVRDSSLKACSSCGGEMEVLGYVDIVHELTETAENMGSRVEFISTDFEEGAQLMNAFGGIAAILRYSTGI